MKTVWKAVGESLDLLVAPSFCSVGFSVRERTWAADALDVDLKGKVFIVTGANSGIGKVTARELARRNGTVVMACRNLDRAQTAKEDITAAVSGAELLIELVDMGDLESVREFVARLVDRGIKISGLIHNAGLLVDRRMDSAQGLELTFAVHVLGPHLLTRLIVEAEIFSPSAQVIFVSSGGMYTQRLQVRSLGQGQAPFDGTIAYAQAKRAQVVLSRLWNSELSHLGVRVNAMHPGWADTPGVLKSLPQFHRLTRPWLRTPDEGADTVVWLAVSSEVEERGGEFFFDREARSEFLPGSMMKHSREDEAELWALCEDLTK